MDRSGRGTAVVAWAIAAGVLFGGAATAAPASADDRSTDAPGNVDRGPEGRAPARGDADNTAPARVVRGRGPHHPVPPPPDPCPWPWPLPVIPSSAPPARPPQGGAIVALPNIASVTPVPIFGDRRIVLGDRQDGDISLSPPPLQPPESPPVGGSVPTAPGSAPSALVAPSPVVPPAVPVVAASPADPPEGSVPNLPAPGLVGPDPAAAAAVPSAPQPPDPQSYLPELRPDDLGRIASTALPGLAALAGLTLLGGAIGYRQARAGYLLRAAGAGRFLQ